MGVANLHPRVLEGISHAPREESEVLSFPFFCFNFGKAVQTSCLLL